MYCLGGCPRGEYRRASHRRVPCRYPAYRLVHRRGLSHSSPFLRAEYLMGMCRLSEALQGVYLTGPLTARMIRRRQMPATACSVPARMWQESMQQIAWKYFRNLMCSRRQKFLQ
jgi:hypothetical protein